MDGQHPDAAAAQPADQIDDMADMSVAQTGYNRYLVTNRASGSVYAVNLAEPSCDCPDFKYTPEDDESDACKHILYAGFQAPAEISAETWALDQLSAYVTDLHEATTLAEDVAGQLEQQLVNTRSAQADGDTADDGPTVEDPVQRCKVWMDANGVDPDKFDIWVDDEYGSLQFATDGYLDDDEYSAFMDLVQDEDAVTYDNQHDRNYIKPEDFAEVLAQ